MAFFGEGKATANVKAKERSLLWRLSHGNLMEYLNEYKGAGQMCLNLAAILAHRLKEGNTRLNGLAGGLSTYFGLKSQLLDQEVETPVSGDPAGTGYYAPIHVGRMNLLAGRTLRGFSADVGDLLANQCHKATIVFSGRKNSNFHPHETFSRQGNIIFDTENFFSGSISFLFRNFLFGTQEFPNF